MRLKNFLTKRLIEVIEGRFEVRRADFRPKAKQI